MKDALLLIASWHLIEILMIRLFRSSQKALSANRRLSHLKGLCI